MTEHMPDSLLDNMGKISIISVCYNEEPEKIRGTMNSIIAQDYPQMEIIVIDGGSKNDTLEAFEEYRDYINCMVSEPDDGIFHAMNKGISKATGDWIIFMNIGDKFYSPNSLSGLMAGGRSDVDILYGNVVMADDLVIMPVKKLSKYGLYRRNICHQALLARRSLFSRIGLFDLNYKVCGDPEWVIRAYKAGTVFKYMDLIVSYYEGNGFSSNYDRRLVYWKKLLRQHY